MKRLRKIFLSIATLLLLIVVIVAATGTWLVRRAWPQVSGSLNLAGLSAPVEIKRDEWGVPHIYAANEPDLFFAQGYVHAQDRLWQMEFGRRIGAGRLSEILGEPTVDIDRYIRTVGLRRAAELDLGQLDSESRAVLDQYAAGVNAYIETHGSALPVEFTILRYTPEPWAAVDTLTWGKLMGLNLAGDYGLDLVRAQTIAKYGVEKTQQVLPLPNTEASMLDAVDHYAWLDSMPRADQERFGAMLRRPILHQGSNSWVVHASRTADGHALMADDTHLGLNMPVTWYQNHLSGGRFNSTGFTLPGVPLVLIGRNDRISWGATNLSTDIQDLYIEKLNDPENPTQYEFKGEWRDLEIINEQIKVSGQEPVTLTVRRTHHGPIINDVEASLSDGEPVAMQWPDLLGSPLFKAVIDMNLASNWEEFRTALRSWGSPKQNFVYADVDGNIGYQAVSKVPLRAPNHLGTLPVPGWSGEYEWQGFIPFEDLPTHYNPPEGYIVAANSRVEPKDSSKYALEYFGVASYRAQQIKQALAANDSVTMDDMKQLQATTHSLQAEAMVPYLLGITPVDEQQERVLALVRDWDKRYETDRVGASIFEVWYWSLQQNILRDELGEDLMFEYLRYGLATSPKLNALMEDVQNRWFDDVTTPAVETRDDMLQRSLADTIKLLTERHGSDPSQWTWGRIHTITFVHQPFGQTGIAPVDRLFNSGPVPARGGDFTINNAWYSVVEPFTMEGGTTQRILLDMGNPSSGLAIQATGQSERLFHRHRTDMIDMWQNVQYHPMLFTRESIDGGSTNTLTLTPAGTAER